MRTFGSELGLTVKLKPFVLKPFLRTGFFYGENLTKLGFADLGIRLGLLL